MASVSTGTTPISESVNTQVPAVCQGPCCLLPGWEEVSSSLMDGGALGGCETPGPPLSELHLYLQLRWLKIKMKFWVCISTSNPRLLPGVSALSGAPDLSFLWRVLLPLSKLSLCLVTGVTCITCSCLTWGTQHQWSKDSSFYSRTKIWLLTFCCHFLGLLSPPWNKK